MSLINCPDCQNEVSSNAPSCPKCGAPISGENKASQSNLVTTQLTRKTLKIQGALSVLTIIIGVIMITPTAQTGEPSLTGILLTLGGLAWFFVTRVRTWWHHS